MKKTWMLALVGVLFSVGVSAQTNLQTHYDFGADRQHVTLTLEGFYNDKWGNTFFFIDYDFNSTYMSEKSQKSVFAPSGTYFEIARCLNFWQNVPVLKDFSLQVEYNGGVYNQYSYKQILGNAAMDESASKYSINNAFLFGVDYCLHDETYRNVFNFKVLARLDNYTNMYYSDGTQWKAKLPMQFTFVWGMQDIFNVKGLRFNGFMDFWWQEHMVMPIDAKTGEVAGSMELSSFCFISEPQIWYNVGQHFGCPNLNVGGELELSYDFGSAKGFKCRPALGFKWQF